MFDGQISWKAALLIAIPALTLGLPACDKNSAATGDSQDDVVAEGAFEVDSVEAAGTVTAINESSRDVTMRWDNGQVVKYRAGPDAVNFGQVRVGDRVKAAVVEGVALYIGPGNVPPLAADASTVALSPRGSKPGVVLVNTLIVTAQVTSIDPAMRTVTLQGPDGLARLVRVAPGVNMSGLRIGDNVAARVTEAVAIRVMKP